MMIADITAVYVEFTLKNGEMLVEVKPALLIGWQDNKQPRIQGSDGKGFIEVEDYTAVSRAQLHDMDNTALAEHVTAAYGAFYCCVQNDWYFPVNTSGGYEYDDLPEYIMGRIRFQYLKNLTEDEEKSY